MGGRERGGGGGEGGREGERERPARTANLDMRKNSSVYLPVCPGIKLTFLLADFQYSLILTL